jgi:hypothetical protein
VITTFDLQTNTVSNGVGTITSVGNGIYRCSITGNSTGAATTQIRLGINNSLIPNAGFYNESYLGVVGQGTYVWGAQFEQGAFPTSYIPTTAASVMRAQDSCMISPPLGPWFVTTVGSWLTEFVYLNPAPNNSRIVTTNNTSGSWAPIFITPPAVQGAQYDGIAAVNTLNTLSVGAVNKVATTWIAGQAKVCSNGGAVATSAALTQGYFVAAGGGVFFMTPVPTPTGDNTTGYLRRVTYWPRVLSDAEMQQVTT